MKMSRIKGNQLDCFPGLVTSLTGDETCDT